jgi:hypothetical protein
MSSPVTFIIDVSLPASYPSNLFLHRVDLLRFGRFSCSLVWLLVGLFRSTVSSLARVAALVRWSFGVIARRLSVCLLQQALPGDPVMEGRGQRRAFGLC